jgi:hypothetical protein
MAGRPVEGGGSNRAADDGVRLRCVSGAIGALGSHARATGSLNRVGIDRAIDGVVLISFRATGAV